MPVAKRTKNSRARELGPFFRAKRLEAGVAVGATAAYLECDEKTFLQYESGERSLPLDLAYALANFLNVEPDEVLRVITTDSALI